MADRESAIHLSEAAPIRGILGLKLLKIRDSAEIDVASRCTRLYSGARFMMVFMLGTDAKDSQGTLRTGGKKAR